MPCRLVAAFALLTACAPERAPDFAGEYEAAVSRWTCRHDHPEGTPYHVRAYLDPIAIDEGRAETLSIALPMPPCTIRGTVVDTDLHLRAEDCVEHHAGTAYIEPMSIEYYDGEGVASWDDGQIELTIETGRRYTSVPDGFPEWWDDPGSCDAEYVLIPAADPA
jgi:hypothetical protein